jgi:hypothetical protein
MGEGGGNAKGCCTWDGYGNNDDNDDNDDLV